MPTIIELTRAQLKAQGYDGLCNPDAECGCKLDELFPCDEPSMVNCEAGYLGPPPPDKADECDWYIWVHREDAKNAGGK